MYAQSVCCLYLYEKTYNDKMEMIETECPWIELSATSHQIRHIEFPLFLHFVTQSHS